MPASMLEEIGTEIRATCALLDRIDNDLLDITLAVEHLQQRISALDRNPDANGIWAMTNRDFVAIKQRIDFSRAKTLGAVLDAYDVAARLDGGQNSSQFRQQMQEAVFQAYGVATPDEPIPDGKENDSRGPNRYTDPGFVEGAFVKLHGNVNAPQSAETQGQPE